MKANTVQLRGARMVSASDVLAFAVELVAIAAITTWGWRSGGWLGAAGSFVALAGVWGTFLSPQAAVPVTGVAWPLVKLAVFAGSALSLSSVSTPLTALAFLALCVASVMLGGTR
ncbi:DUF2568 domain-containing protein [Deinococcus sp. KSM4-11]|uniref:YrdB family protein n=1 Tax=Deinococcus sp. KSM4-11 TaxID=2568654 RepID=UPI0010A4537E|nr:YrdB family protein [Deinococcus sp. KSM4-11]THF88266.1 DUF2568 domain-containing protein [Deinococcus sp. KSM4-11]